MDRRTFLQGTAAVAALAACGSKPNADGCAAAPTACPTPGVPGDAYFAQLQEELRAREFGTPQMVIDLDRLDWNADRLVEGIGAHRYRMVEKSLPSLELLDHISHRTGSNRFMVMHMPFLPGILQRFPDAHVMLGKPQPVAAAKWLLRNVEPAAAARVTFVVDSARRLQEYLDLGVPLRIAIDIDVGLHRGGVRSPAQLPELLAILSANPSLTFDGLLGYDGHIPAAPSPPGLEEATFWATYRAARDTFQRFVDIVKNTDLWRDDLIFNSGGTQTYPMYVDGPVNDISVGGGMLRPHDYSDVMLGALRPASFITAPVLDAYDEVALPLIKGLSKSLFEGNKQLTIYGGGWAAVFVWPEGISNAPIVSGDENHNLVPNQAWLFSPRKMAPGDWVFLHPRQGDAIFQFQDILLVRDGHLLDEVWHPFPSRY